MLKIAFQMDPIEKVDVDADTTFDIAVNCFERGHRCFYYQPSDLAFVDRRVVARGQEIEELKRVRGDHVKLGVGRRLDLSEMDVVFLRQDPPFDMAYITSTHLLEHLQPKVLVVNDPVSVRNAPEKLFVTRFENLMPPTLIASNREEIDAFAAEHQDVIVKPLYGNGGAGVFRLRAGDPNLDSLLELFTERSREPVIVQRFVPEVARGDKRVLLLDGEPFGAINRVPLEGQVRANMHVGGRAEATELSERDLEICRAIGPALRERGLTLVGIDVIGDYITEINVTSPTGVQELKRFSGLDYSAKLIDWVEARRAA